MTKSPAIQSTLLRYQEQILMALRRALQKASEQAQSSVGADFSSYYGQMHYHLGWVDTRFAPVTGNPGKLLRPTLLLLAYEAAGAWNLDAETAGQTIDHLKRALPAAAAVELIHNFTLIHDDIEDGDAERRHRPTLWKIWGIPQAINTGDGMFALARLTLWDIWDKGVEPSIAVHLGAILDHTCLVITEGQYLDISFEKRLNISVSMYLDVIRRKTAVLMGCAAEMGAMLGTSNRETIERLRDFGLSMGMAFQVRDDLLGVWASTEESGKTPAGDLYRRKKSLPVLHSLEQASSDDRKFLSQVYTQEEPITNEQVDEVLAVFARTGTRAYCNMFLSEQCRLAYEALANVPRNSSPSAERAIHDMEMLVHFVEDTVN